MSVADLAGRRVCHITTAHPVDDHRILHKECVTLVAAGYEVTLIAPHTRRERMLGVDVVPLPARSVHRAARMAKRPLMAYRLARQLDAELYHFHDPDFLPYAVLLARGGKRVIYDAHEHLFRQILSKHWIWPPARPLAAHAVGRVEALAIKRATAVVCANPPMVERFRALNDRVAVVANYPRLDEITPAPWEQKGTTICYIGGISQVRGAVELVDAMASVDAELLLAGLESTSALLASLTAQPGWERVRYLGRLGRAEIGHVLDQARIGMLPLHAVPSHVVAYPVKLFEYMAAAIPVVASDVQPWAEIISTSGCGICVPAGDAAALAEAINHLLANPAEARAMGERGRQAVEQTYSWESEATKLLALYTTLLA